MKIESQTGERLVLSGVPGGRGWMIFATVLGVVLTAAVVAAAIYEFKKSGLNTNHLWIGLGAFIAQAIFWTGAVTLAVGRERLELDRVTNQGAYTVRSPIVETERPCSFSLDRIAAVVVEYRTESRPHRTDGRASFDAQVVTAKLRITKPRRAIVLDETQNNGAERGRAMADSVAGFLGIQVRDEGRRPPRPSDEDADDPPRRRTDSPDAAAENEPSAARR